MTFPHSQYMSTLGADSKLSMSHFQTHPHSNTGVQELLKKVSSMCQHTPKQMALPSWVFFSVPSSTKISNKKMSNVQWRWNHQPLKTFEPTLERRLAGPLAVSAPWLVLVLHCFNCRISPAALRALQKESSVGFVWCPWCWASWHVGCFHETNAELLSTIRIKEHCADGDYDFL